jgi:hypothetical protein
VPADTPPPVDAADLDEAVRRQRAVYLAADAAMP